MTRRSKRKILTSKERVLTHLRGFQKYYEDADAPLGVTQDGIADAVGVGRNNVSKILKELIEEGFVEVLSKHVRGMPTVRKVYFPAGKGIEEAQRIREEVESMVVDIIDMDGGNHKDRIGRLNGYLPRRYELLQLVNGIDNGVFNASSFHSSFIRSERSFVDYTDRKPTVRRFFGREREIGKLKSVMNAPEARAIVVHGVAGIGKTTLLSMFAQRMTEENNVFWFHVQEWVHLRMVLKPLAEFLSEMGERGLEMYLDRTEEPLLGDVIPLIEDALSNRSAILIFDDVQKANDGMNTLLRAIVDLTGHNPSLKLLCSSRQIPSFYSRSMALDGSIREITLEGLDMDSALRMLEARDIPMEKQFHIYQRTSGHPLFLELVDEPGEVIGQDLRLFLEQELLQNLTKEERSIMEIASTFRYPVIDEAFFAVEEGVYLHRGKDITRLGYEDFSVDYDAIESLIRKSLLKESIGRLLGTHDMIREFFYSRIPRKRRMLYHLAASEYYLEGKSPSSYLEAIWHSQQSGDHERTVNLCVLYGEAVIKGGFPDGLKEIIHRLMGGEDPSTSRERIALLNLDAKVLEMGGDPESALERYDELLTLVDPQVEPRFAADLWRRKGSILVRMYKADEAYDCLKMALKHANSLDDRSTICQIQYDLGGMYLARGDHERAMKCYRKAAEDANEIDDEVSMGRAVYGMARAENERMHYEEALTYSRKALSILEDSGDLAEVAKAMLNLALSLRQLERFEECSEIMERCMDLAKEVGDLYIYSYMISNLVALRLEVDDLEGLEPIIQEGESAFISQGNLPMAKFMHLYMGVLQLKYDRFNEALSIFNEGLSGLEHGGLHHMRALWLYEIGNLLRDRGMASQARSYYRQGLELASSESLSDLVSDCQEALEKC